MTRDHGRRSGLAHSPQMHEVRRAAWETWIAHAPIECQVARDAALSAGWPDESWTLAYGRLVSVSHQPGYPIWFGTVSPRPWQRLIANADPFAPTYVYTYSPVRRWAPAGHGLSWIPQDRRFRGGYPEHFAADRIESIRVLGKLLLPGYTPFNVLGPQRVFGPQRVDTAPTTWADVAAAAQRVRSPTAVETMSVLISRSSP